MKPKLDNCPFCGAEVMPCDESPLYGRSLYHPVSDGCLFSNHTLWGPDIYERWNMRARAEAGNVDTD